MTWLEISRGVWERPMGENETFIKLIADTGLPFRREHWAITLQVSFTLKGVMNAKSSQLEQTLREAWKHLRSTQPSIAATVVNDKVRYQVPDPSSIATWLDETFIVASPETTASDIIANRKPSSSSVLHYLPHESQILLQTSHWRTDGVGIFLILDVYFDLVCQCAAGAVEPIIWGSEISRLAPSAEDASNLSHDDAPELMSVAARCLASFRLTADTVGMQFIGDSATMPAGTHAKHLQLSETESTAIFNGARSRNISVTSAIHASVARTNYHFAIKVRNSKPYTSTIRFGLRPYVPERYAGREYGSILLTSGYMFQVQPERSWLENAQAFSAEYRKGYSTIMPAHRQYAAMLGEIVRNMPPPDPNNLPSDMDISSIGIVDRFIVPIRKAGDAEIEVTNVAVGTEILTRQMVCYVWTFRGRLNLQITYNEAFHQDEQVRDIIQHVVDVTLEELGVVEGRDSM